MNDMKTIVFSNTQTIHDIKDVNYITKMHFPHMKYEFIRVL